MPGWPASLYLQLSVNWLLSATANERKTIIDNDESCLTFFRFISKPLEMMKPRHEVSKAQTLDLDLLAWEISWNSLIFLYRSGGQIVHVTQAGR